MRDILVIAIMLLGCVTLRIQLGAHDVAPALSNLIKVVLRAYGVHYKGIAISVEQVERTSLEIQTL